MKKSIRRSVITVLKQTTLVLFAFSLPPARSLSDAADRPAKGTAMRHFSVETDAVPLPRGATAKARRVQISRGGKLITALSQGSHRAYLYPVFTPAGAAVTTESPIDHPHHQSITIGADHFNVYYPYSTDKFEEANYNFYVNETFQGRSAGRIVGIGFEAEEMSEDHLRIVQNLEWRGAAEWGAPAQGRVLAHETRTIDIHTGKTANIIDIRSALRPGEWDFSIGPTRHAYFTIRLADGLHETDGGTIVDSENRRGADRINGRTADWVDYSGPGPHGRGAGIAVFLHPSLGNPPWHVAEWSTITINPLATAARRVNRGETLELAVRIVAHDGDADQAGIAELYEAFQKPR